MSGDGAEDRVAAEEGRVESTVEDRVAAAAELLAAAGLEAEVGVAGLDGEIAAIRGDASARGRLAELAPAIRALGFRFVALELGDVTRDNGNT